MAFVRDVFVSRVGGGYGLQQEAGGGPRAGERRRRSGAKVDAGPPPVVGMDDPFARMTGDAAKSLKAGYKAMQAKKYDEARAAFAAVVSAAPDYSPARMQEMKAAALGGHAADVPALWKDLLARDFVAFAGRLDKPKELAPLRAGPEWARIKAQEASIQPAYAADLGKGLFFIARGRDAVVIRRPAKGRSKLELNQELFQVDPARSAIGGSARRRAGCSPIRSRRSARRSRSWSWRAWPTRRGRRRSSSSRVWAAIDLATLETTGPLRLGPAGTRAARSSWAGSGQGDPVWIVRGLGGGPAATRRATRSTRPGRRRSPSASPASSPAIGPRRRHRGS